MMNDVDKFLKRFHCGDDVDTVFTCSCCYWLAYILYMRFIRNGAEVMYDRVANHFGTKIFGKVYDITGDVTTDYDWISWSKFDDELEKKRIIRDFIMF